ncbi:MAG: hypothetical protein N3B13_12885, partial [Deltaproteobacteria bacterium]|nr:hypothetical protein [Deltaproteobacteria bacterium]
CALLTTGGVECWGSNWDGQLGYQGGDTHKPVPVIGLSSGVTTISSGYDHTCAVLNTGEVKCWGTNKMVQLGINDPNKYKSEIPVPICITK